MNAQSMLQREARAMLKHYSTSTAGAPACSNSITIILDKDLVKKSLLKVFEIRMCVQLESPEELRKISICLEERCHIDHSTVVPVEEAGVFTERSNRGRMVPGFCSKLMRVKRESAPMARMVCI